MKVQAMIFGLLVLVFLCGSFCAIQRVDNHEPGTALYAWWIACAVAFGFGMVVSFISSIASLFCATEAAEKARKEEEKRERDQT